MNDILEGKTIPQTWQNAIISVLPKQEDSCPEVKNFRPISLLNVDYNIFTKIIAERLKRVLNKYIGEDQAGFLPGRHIRENVRTVLNILEYADKTPAEKIGFFFLDAEKAFDNVDWQFMKQLLMEIAFGGKCQNVIEKIYSKQEAAIRINKDLTETLHVQKGTRQGCPLSPLLFILVLEVLLKSIQEDDCVKGIKIKGFHFKYWAYADDIVFFVQNQRKTYQK